MIAAKYIDQITIRNNGREELTNAFISLRPMVGYHVSAQPIKALGIGQAICLYPSIPNVGVEAEGTVITRDTVYQVNIPANTEIACFGEHEYRIIVCKNTTAQIVGEMQTVKFDKPVRTSPFRPGYTSTIIRFVAK